MTEGNFGFFPPLDPEQIEAAKEEQRRGELELEEFRHAFQRMLTELSQEQLEIWRKMLNTFIEASQMYEGTPPVLPFVTGQISWEMKTRFNICTTCSKDHDKEIHNQASDPNPQPEVKTVHDGVDPMIEHARTPDGIMVWSAREIELMKEYHLDDLYAEQEGGHIFMGFKCTGIQGSPGPCGVNYPSLEDRMLKGPEECSGCFQRVMHG